MTASQRLWRFLRSRKLAVWLLIGACAWSILGTAVPQAGSPEWSTLRVQSPLVATVCSVLGLDQAFTAPLFVAAMMLLGVSTILCSVDRTTWALGRLRSPAGISTAALDRMRRAEPDLVTALGVEDAQRVIGDGLRAKRFRVRLTAQAIQADAARLGLLGSPVFHWSLAGLFVTVTIGAVTGASGLIGIPVGGALPNVAPEYGLYSAGPLHGEWASGLTIAVPRFDSEVAIGDVSVGAVPVVELRRGSRVLIRDRSYANHPLRYGPLFIHNNAVGWVGYVVTRSATGASQRARIYFDYVSADSDVLGGARMSFELGNDPSLDVSFTPVKGSAINDTRKSILIEIPATPASSAVSTVVAEGQRVPLGDATIAVEDISVYARLSVVENWMIYPIYFFFIVATIGLTFVTLVSYRRVRVLLSSEAGGTTVRIETFHQRGDPSFRTDMLALLGPLEEADGGSP
jgi:cytochrome c biogenesis protein ResB